ncbi:MAG: DUF5803 family protein [Haloarculaceae archaeon]
MTRRRLVALGLLALLLALGGCSSLLGPGQPSQEKLTANQSYDWDTDANATYVVSRTQFTVVLAVENQSYVKVYQTDELGTEEPLSIKGLKFRYPDGRVVTAADPGLYANNSRHRKNITLPADEGKVAFTASRPNAKRFSTPAFVSGSQEVVLPPRTRVGIPLLSRVRPPADDKSVNGTTNRMTIHWDDVGGSVSVRYYLQRDILLFGGLGGILAVAGVIGVLYYLRQIKALERRREEVGLDVETEDDDTDREGPPPGMR